MLQKASLMHEKVHYLDGICGFLSWPTQDRKTELPSIVWGHWLK